MDGPGFISFLTDHGYEDTSTARKVQAINDAQWDLASRQAWPFLEAQIDLVFNGSSPTPTNIPTDLGTVLQVVNVATGAIPRPSREDDYTKWYVLSATDVADPFTFYFVGRTMKFHPVPPASTVIRMIYIRVPPTVTETSLESAFLVPPRHHSAVAYLALASLAFMEDDAEVAVGATQKAELRIQSMMADSFERQLQEPDFIHMTDTDDLDYYFD